MRDVGKMMLHILPVDLIKSSMGERSLSAKTDQEPSESFQREIAKRPRNKAPYVSWKIFFEQLLQAY